MTAKQWQGLPPTCDIQAHSRVAFINQQRVRLSRKFLDHLDHGCRRYAEPLREQRCADISLITPETAQVGSSGKIFPNGDLSPIETYPLNHLKQTLFSKVWTHTPGSTLARLDALGRCESNRR